ncbi:class I SAM-dependent RNA methyltransferase [Nocardia altamirensis]|uniref:class I SAM-dependent RNA methyltransferase n=1 Tax=Nocardia altamirensis TaxID=472158 RepID=UPI000A98F2F3|nr:TRAM domain-containing protein [Nocardia altamirensis]
MTDWRGTTFEVRLGPPGHGGFCVGRHEGRVVFVRHGLPDELVLVRVTEDRGGSFCRADAIEILEPSPDRIPATCPVSGPGGAGCCDFSYATPEAQRALKASVVAEQLRRLAGIEREVVVEPITGAGDATGGWRTRIRLAVDTQGRAGVHGYRSTEVITDLRCPQPVSGALDGVADRLWTPGADLVVAVDGDGVRHIIELAPAAEGDRRGARGAQRVESDGRRSDQRGRDRRGRAGAGGSGDERGNRRRPGIKSGSEWRADDAPGRPQSPEEPGGVERGRPRRPGEVGGVRRTNHLRRGDAGRAGADRRSDGEQSDRDGHDGDRQRYAADGSPETPQAGERRSASARRAATHAARDEWVISGTGRAVEYVADRRWEVSATGFWQAHHRAAQCYSDLVAEWSGLRPGGLAWDLYSGAGVFAARLADQVGQTGAVLAVESARSAVADGTAALRDLTWLDQHAQRVERWVAERVGGAAPDVVVLDPPRAGAGKEVIAALAATGPLRIIHIGCDPAAFARDLGLYQAAGYQLADLRAFDAFPATHHVECIALLDRQPAP